MTDEGTDSSTSVYIVGAFGLFTMLMIMLHYYYKRQHNNQLKHARNNIDEEGYEDDECLHAGEGEGGGGDVGFESKETNKDDLL